MCLHRPTPLCDAGFVLPDEALRHLGAARLSQGLPATQGALQPLCHSEKLWLINHLSESRAAGDPAEKGAMSLSPGSFFPVRKQSLTIRNLASQRTDAGVRRRSAGWGTTNGKGKEGGGRGRCPQRGRRGHS